jgi:hypothetical protein
MQFSFDGGEVMVLFEVGSSEACSGDASFVCPVVILVGLRCVRWFGLLVDRRDDSQCRFLDSQEHSSCTDLSAFTVSRDYAQSSIIVLYRVDFLRVSIRRLEPR